MKKSLFYFAYFGTNEDSYEVLLERFSYIFNQLKYMRSIEAKESFHKFFIVYTAPPFLKDLIAHASQQLDFTVFESQCSSENLFEYPGFAAMQEYANSLEDEELLFYSHSKGSVNRHPSANGALKLNLLTNFCCDLSPVENDPQLNKAGLFTTISGTVWFNFFWIKSSFMKNVNVQKNENRYRFEQMIKDAKGSSALCIMGNFLKEYLGYKKETTFSSHEINQNPRLRNLQQSLGTTDEVITSLESLEHFIKSMPSHPYPFENFLVTPAGGRLFYMENKLLIRPMKSCDRAAKIVSYDIVEGDQVHLHFFMGKKCYITWDGEKFIETKTPAIFELAHDTDGVFALRFEDRIAICHEDEITFKSQERSAQLLKY